MYSESEVTILNRLCERQGLSNIPGTSSHAINSSFAIELADIKSSQDDIVNQSNIIDAFENGYDEAVIKFASADGVDLKPALLTSGTETFRGLYTKSGSDSCIYGYLYG